MAFAYNSGGLVTGDSAANPIQFNFTAGTNSKIIVLTLSIHVNGALGSGGTPTYDTNNMTQLGTSQYSAEGATEIWYYLSPVAGVAKQVSIPNANTHDIRYSCSDYTNADYSATLFGSDLQTNGAAADVVATVASVPEGSVCVSCMVHGEKDQFASLSVLTSFFGTPSVDEGNMQTGGGYSIQSTTEDETHTYTSGGSSDDFNHVMGVWKEQTAPTPTGQVIIIIG